MSSFSCFSLLAQCSCSAESRKSTLSRQKHCTLQFFFKRVGPIDGCPDTLCPVPGCVYVRPECLERDQRIKAELYLSALFRRENSSAECYCWPEKVRKPLAVQHCDNHNNNNYNININFGGKAMCSSPTLLRHVKRWDRQLSMRKKHRPAAQHPARISAGSPRVGPGGCKTKTCCQRGNGKMLLGSWREACVTRCVRATQRKHGKSSRWPADASLISDSYDNAGSLLSPSSKQQSKQELGLPSRRGFPKCLVWTWRPRPWHC